MIHEFDDDRLFIDKYFYKNSSYTPNNKESSNNVNKLSFFLNKSKQKLSFSQKIQLHSYSNNRLAKFKLDTSKKSLQEFGNELIQDYKEVKENTIISKNVLKKTMKFLRNYLETLDNDFLQVFTCIIDIFDQSLFLQNQKQEILSISQEFINSIHDQKLKKYLTYNKISHYPYNELFLSVLHELESKTLLYDSLKKTHQNEILKLTSFYEQNLNKMSVELHKKTIDTEINKISTPPSTSEEIQTLNDKIKLLEEKLQSSENDFLAYIEENKKQIDRRLSLKRKDLVIEEPKASNSIEFTLKQAQKEILQLKNDLNISIFKQKEQKKACQEAQNFAQKTLIKLKSLTNDYFTQKTINEKLVSERKDLVIRAAVSYEDLTPRPHLKKIAQEREIDFDKIQDLLNNCEKKTTIEKFEFLLEKIVKNSGFVGNKNHNFLRGLEKKKTMEILTPIKDSRDIKKRSIQSSSKIKEINEVATRKRGMTTRSSEKIPEMTIREILKK